MELCAAAAAAPLHLTESRAFWENAFVCSGIWLVRRSQPERSRTSHPTIIILTRVQSHVAAAAAAAFTGAAAAAAVAAACLKTPDRVKGKISGNVAKLHKSAKYLEYQLILTRIFFIWRKRKIYNFDIILTAWFTTNCNCLSEGEKPQGQNNNN